MDLIQEKLKQTKRGAEVVICQSTVSYTHLTLPTKIYANIAIAPGNESGLTLMMKSTRADLADSSTARSTAQMHQLLGNFIFDAAMERLLERRDVLKQARSSPSLRVVHTALGGREASLFTVQVTNSAADASTTTRYIGVLWQITTSPPLFVCLTLSCIRSMSTVLSQCSCSPMSGERCIHVEKAKENDQLMHCLLYTSPSPRDLSTSRMPSSA